MIERRFHRSLVSSRGGSAGLAVTLLLTVALGGTACASRRVPTELEGPSEGEASWYGVDFHGRRAADGSRYNMYELTAAHRTLEFGTRVVVTNIGNGRSVEVTITDRGPFVDGRIIDLSFVAAQQIGMLDTGVARVRLEVVD
jgi:rare lipoprotein A